MTSVNAWRGLGAIGIVETAARQRAANYRERAAHLTAMAVAETDHKLRGELADLASQYEELSESLDAGGG
jgi:hypothetical protein